MSTGNNVNENVLVQNHNYNVNDNGSKYARARQVETTADILLAKFGLDETSRGFMCKVAYKLSEARIWGHVDHVFALPKKGAKPIKNKVGMFIWLCKRDMIE